MSDIHALSGAYAVDALDDIERAQFERHLVACDTCQDEVDSLRDATAALADTTLVTPSTGLRDRVLADIAAVRPLPPEVTGPVAQLGRARRRWAPALVAAAAAVVAIGGGGVVYQQLNDDTSQSPSTSAVDRIVNAQDAERFTSTVPGGGKATIVRSKALNEAVVMTEGMSAAPDGRAYALWLQHDHVMVPAGTMEAGASTAILHGDAATASGAGITVENADVEPITPSDDVVAVFDFASV